MGNTVVDFSGVASASSSVSITASATPSMTRGYVAPSQSPAPSPVGYAKSAVLAPGLTLSWNRVGDRFDFQAVYTGLAWISVGFSADGMMQGPAGQNSNVMIASFGPSGASVGQFDMLGYAGSQIVAHATSGVSAMSAYQTGGTSVMRWSRNANNGDANGAQISLTGVSNVVWAYGLGNVYATSPLPPMGNTVVDFSGLAAPSATASPSPSPGAGTLYAHAVELTDGLTLRWSVTGDVYTFKAVLNRVAW